MRKVFLYVFRTFSLVSIKPKFSDKFFNFYEKNSNFTIFRKVLIILKITKKLE